MVGRFTDAEKPTCWCENCIVPPLLAEPSEFPNLSKTVTETELEMFPCIVTLLMGRGEKTKSEVIVPVTIVAFRSPSTPYWIMGGVVVQLPVPTGVL